MSESVRMAGTTCWCGTPFHLPERLLEAAQKSGHTIYCPHGHSVVWKQTEADRLRQERDRLQQRLAEKDDEIKWQRDHREAAERRVSAAKGQITRLKNRAKAGMCPCCNRHFTNLERHMATKHPNADAEPAFAVIEGGKG